MKLLNVTLIAFILFFTFACSFDDEVRMYVSLDSNGDMEEVDPVNSSYALGWSLRAENFNPPNNYTYRRTDKYAASGSYSAMLKADEVDSPDEFWYLIQEIDIQDIPLGAELTLRIKVKTVNLQGKGFEVAMYGQHEFEPHSGIYRSSYEVTKQVSGDNDWEEYVMQIPAFPSNLRNLNVLLILSPNTTGEVYFDDLKLGYVSR